MATATLKANRTMPNTGKWQDRHDAACETLIRTKFEFPLVRMVTEWAQYAGDHQREYESLIGNDGVLGPEWLQIGKSLRALLNGNTGRLDCGTVDAYLLDVMHANGFTAKDWL